LTADKLINSTEFNDLIKWYCSRRGVDRYEMTQEIFAEILETGADTLESCRKIANRVTMKEARLKRDIDDREISYSEGDDESDVHDSNMKNWYWRGCDPRMNEDVEPGMAWE
jgi:hypothetical protein